MIKCLLSSISTRISLEPVRTPEIVKSMFSPFLKKFLELDPLTGPEQALCVCMDSRYWFAAESFSCILGDSNSSSFFWLSFYSSPNMSLCFCLYLLYLLIAQVLKVIWWSVYRWVLEISFYPASFTRYRTERKNSQLCVKAKWLRITRVCALRGDISSRE